MLEYGFVVELNFELDFELNFELDFELNFELRAVFYWNSSKKLIWISLPALHR